MLIGCDGDYGREWELWERVCGDVADRRVGQELHDHADVIGNGREHHRGLEAKTRAKTISMKEGDFFQNQPLLTRCMAELLGGCGSISS